MKLIWYVLLSSLFYYSGLVTAAIDGHDTYKAAYVEVNDHNIGAAGCYKEKDQNLFDTAVIFAANIVEDGTDAKVRFNRNVEDLLDNNIEIIRDLQKKGIKVVLSILGDHQNAGWGCFSSYSKAVTFARNAAQIIYQYGLDGIDIDDEYSTCSDVANSLPRVTLALRKELRPHHLITKSMTNDISDFQEIYSEASPPRYDFLHFSNERLINQLDKGWDMTYRDPFCTHRLKEYWNRAAFNQKPSKLGIGISTQYGSAVAAQIAQCMKEDYPNSKNVMIFNLRADSLPFLQSIWDNVTADKECLAKYN